MAGAGGAEVLGLKGDEPPVQLDGEETHAPNVEDKPLKNSFSGSQLSTHFVLRKVDLDHDFLEYVRLSAKDEIVRGNIPTKHFVGDDFH